MTALVNKFAFPLLTGAIFLFSLPALAAGSEDPDWPCVQRLVPELSAATVWDGPPIDDAVKAWPKTPTILDLVSRITARRTPLEEGEKAITAFAQTLGAKKDTMLTMVFAGLFATINQERSRLISGIKRYAKGQRRLAFKIGNLTAELSETPPDGPPKDAARRKELHERWVWDTRIYDERERSLQALCEQPVLLEQRLFILSRAIRVNMDD